MNTMKIVKFILLISALTMVATASYSQNVVIQQNSANPSSQKGDDGAYYINGISTREDIGGVEVSLGDPYGNSGRFIKFKNYNSIPVSVIYQLDTDTHKKVTGTIVLQAGEEKQTGQHYYGANNYVLIARPMSTGRSEVATRPEVKNAEPVLLYNSFYVIPDDFEKMSYNTAVETIEKLNGANYCGYSDWRFPSASELTLIRSSDSVKLKNDFYWNDSSRSEDSYTGRLVLVRTNR